MNQKPVILAVETSSRIGSVALALAGNLLVEQTFSASLRHSAEIFPTIRQLLAQQHLPPAAIDQVYVSIGPGSFTGLRIAVAAAKSMHLAGGARIVAVDSLDVIAANVSDAAVAPMIQNHGDWPIAGCRLATVLDAKRGQFFAAVYEWSAGDDMGPEYCGYNILATEKGRWKKIRPDSLMTAAELIDRFARESQPLYVTGDGLLYHQEKFETKQVRLIESGCWSPRAANVHALGYQKACAECFADPLTLAPFYLRGPQVTLRKTPLR